MLTTLVLTTALSLAPYEPLADHATPEQVDQWCADMIDAGHLTDSGRIPLLRQRRKRTIIDNVMLYRATRYS